MTEGNGKITPFIGGQTVVVIGIREGKKEVDFYLLETRKDPDRTEEYVTWVGENG